jgi:cytochrome P450
MEHLQKAAMDQSILLASLATSASIFWLFWRQIRRHLESKKAFEELPMPDSHWCFGHLTLLQGLLRDSRSWTRSGGAMKYCNEYGQIGLWGLGSNRIVVVTHFEDARTILSAEYYRRTPPFASKHIRMFLGEKNIGFLQGREWKLHRSAIYRSISPSVLLESRQAMIDVAETLVATLKSRMQEAASKDLTLEIEPLMKMVTIDIFAKTALTTDLECCNNLKPSPIATAFDFLLQEFAQRVSDPMNPFEYFYSIPTSRNHRHFQERTMLRSFLAQLIKQRKEANLEDQKKDLLANLLQAQHQDMSEGDQGITSDQTLNDTLMALIFAGYDTTSVMLTCALYCLSVNPEVERLCLEEIASLPTSYTPNA